MKHLLTLFFVVLLGLTSTSEAGNIFRKFKNSETSAAATVNLTSVVGETGGGGVRATDVDESPSDVETGEGPVAAAASTTTQRDAQVQAQRHAEEALEEEEEVVAAAVAARVAPEQVAAIEAQCESGEEQQTALIEAAQVEVAEQAAAAERVFEAARYPSVEGGKLDLSKVGIKARYIVLAADAGVDQQIQVAVLNNPSLWTLNADILNYVTDLAQGEDGEPVVVATFDSALGVEADLLAQFIEAARDTLKVLILRNCQLLGEVGNYENPVGKWAVKKALADTPLLALDFRNVNVGDRSNISGLFHRCGTQNAPDGSTILGESLKVLGTQQYNAIKVLEDGTIIYGDWGYYLNEVALHYCPSLTHAYMFAKRRGITLSDGSQIKFIHAFETGTYNPYYRGGAQVENLFSLVDFEQTYEGTHRSAEVRHTDCGRGHPMCFLPPEGEVKLKNVSGYFRERRWNIWDDERRVSFASDWWAPVEAETLLPPIPNWHLREAFSGNESLIPACLADLDPAANPAWLTLMLERPEGEDAMAQLSYDRQVAERKNRENSESKRLAKLGQARGRGLLIPLGGNEHGLSLGLKVATAPAFFPIAKTSGLSAFGPAVFLGLFL